MRREPHPFARFINILGRGKTKTRSLTIEEAEVAMRMILAGEVLPEQLGAFLMLLRVKEESPEEIAGFVRAVRAQTRMPRVTVDVDWPTYAGKRRQLPWFLLAALALARSGRRVVMHGVEGHTEGRIYAREALVRLGVRVAHDLDDAVRLIEKSNFAYLPLEQMSPKLAELFELRPILGLRSPVHTLARLLNPFDAPCSLHSVFHPGYLAIHRDAAQLLGQPRMSVFRGEGGEIERRPNKPCEVITLQDGVVNDELWPPTMTDPRLAPDESMDLDRLGALWRGDIVEAYAEAAVTGTLAIALRTLGEASNPENAQAQAESLWNARDRGRLLAAA
ncbi:MAG: glycosyl transferase family protein [Bradyrhizobium sp.]|uniref:glycosyl transferase family protein n=1 Tax=Bradyrhizobium sp. TaxID=376 RepID=UPI0025C2FF4A|nr:glycosyl transferase family protein [Bradyrhizobium sp.]MBI5263331.1 glycosyl transferase family protein [Bradyrhizobium sp.]